jgi:hypothetical protein
MVIGDFLGDMMIGYHHNLTNNLVWVWTQEIVVLMCERMMNGIWGYKVFEPTHMIVAPSFSTMISD